MPNEYSTFGMEFVTRHTNVPCFLGMEFQIETCFYYSFDRNLIHRTISHIETMLDHNYCKKILEENGDKYSDKEIKMIVDLLEQFAEMNLNIFENLNANQYATIKFDGQS